MIRDMESFQMSPNPNDYVTYGRWLPINSGYGQIKISSGGAFGDPYMTIFNDTYGGGPYITRRWIPGGPFTTLGHSFRLLVGVSTTPIYVNAQDLINSVSHCSVIFNGQTGVVSIANSGGIIFNSAPLQFPINGLFWVEILFTIGAGTSGAVSVKLPNTLIDLTGVNTQNGSRPYCDSIEFSTANGGSAQIQHQIWWDTTGAYNNTWLGDRRVFGGKPQSNGDTDQFTPVGLASNYLNAANAPPNVTDYNVSGTVGAVDLYKASAPSNLTAVAAAMVSSITEKDDSGTRSFANALKSGGVIAFGTSESMTSNYVMNNADVFETDPSTGAPFVPAALPNLQFGGKVSA